MPAPKYSRYYTYIKPVITNKVVRSFAPQIFGIITITIFIVFAIRPTVSTILKLQKQIDENKQVLEQLNNKARNLSQGKANFDNLDPEIKQKIKTSIPDQPNITTLITSLQNSTGNQASGSALQIQPLTLFNANSNPKTSLSVNNVDFSFNTQGTFNQLLLDIYNISKAPRLISIDSITMTKSTGGTVTLSVIGKSYFLK